MRCAPGALPITALLAALALGCGARGPQSSAPQGGELAPGADLGQAVEAPAGEAPADPGAGAPTEESPTMRPDVPPANARLTLDTPLILGGGEGLGDVELTLTSVVAETIEASPEDPESYPAGSGVTVGLRISSDQHQEEAIDFARLSAGYLSKERVLTEGLWIELREVEEAAVTLFVARLGELLEEPPARRITILKDQDVALDDDVAVRLIAHGHKRTYADGPASPLMVTLHYRTTGGELDEVSFSIPPEGTGWSWRDYDFRIVEVRYGASMEVDVGRRRLIPLEPRS